MDQALSDTQLLRDLRHGSESAAAAVFDRYFSRLTALARARLSTRIAARVDPEDVAMSAYRSFFVRARSGDFMLGAGHDLWRLLAEIALHKLYRQTTHHLAQRRAASKEQAVELAESQTSIAREPLPEAGIVLADELESILQDLAPAVRTTFELRLQGYELDEIAAQLNVTRHVVRRQLDKVKQRLRTRFPELTEPKQRSSRVRKSLKPKPLVSLQSRSLLNFNDYLLQQQIGSGGSGKVYRATVRPSNDVVAIKFMRRALLRWADNVERFIREATLVERLDHPGIIRVRGIGRTPNRGFFLAMEFHPRGDLQRQIGPGPIEPSKAVAWVLEAARALEHAHQRGVIHCDLKPSNLLLNERGQVVVSDFGLARSLTDVVAPELAGTPAFLAPEQLDLRWGEVGPATDVYGLGCVLLTLLTGQLPRVGDSRSMLASIAAGEQIPISPDLPYRSLLTRCLATTPEERFATMGEIVSALEVAAGH